MAMTWSGVVSVWGRRLLQPHCRLLRCRHPENPGAPSHTRLMCEESKGRWLWPADRMAAIYDACDRQCIRKFVFCVLFGASQPVRSHHLVQSLTHLQRKFPNLQACLRPRGDALWFYHHPCPAIDFQVLDDCTDINQLRDKLMLVPFSYTDPVQWRARLVNRGHHTDKRVASHPGAFPHPNKDISHANKDAFLHGDNGVFPHQYFLAIDSHHALSDGLDFIIIIKKLMDILDDTLGGRTVDDEPVGIFRNNDEFLPVMEKVRQKLLEDPEKIQSVRSTLPSVHTKPLLLQVGARFGVSSQASRHVTRILDPKLIKNFQQRATENGVGFNSSLTAAINTAISKLAIEAGISQDSHKVIVSHMITKRLYMENQSKHRLGMHGTRLTHSSEVNAKQGFWDYARLLNKELKSAIKTGAPLEQEVVNAMDQPELSPEDFITSFCPSLHDYTLTNVTTLKDDHKIHHDHLQVTGIISYMNLQNYLSNIHQVCRFNDNYCYSVSYDTGYLSEETVNRLLDAVLDVMAINS